EKLEEAPGDMRVKLHSVRLVCEGRVTGDVGMTQDFELSVDYWNLETSGRRIVSFHIYNSTGVCVIATSNLPSACLSPDPWYSKPYPRGLFRSSCTIPGRLLNDGTYTVTICINGNTVQDLIIYMHEVLQFTVHDSGEMRKEYT